jgi:hypothetical protein
MMSKPLPRRLELERLVAAQRIVAAKTADKYIGRDGKAPKPPRSAQEKRNDKVALQRALRIVGTHVSMMPDSKKFVKLEFAVIKAALAADYGIED